MNDLTTTGMILSVMPIGEYDRRVEILSAELGRISAFARGARKPGSPLVSATRVFAFGEFTLYQGKNSYTVHSAKIRNYFDSLTADMDHMYYGFYFLELAQYFSRENLEAGDMLKLLYCALKALGHPSFNDLLVKRIVELKMLEINGLCPSMDRLLAGEGSFSFARDLSGACVKALQRVIGMPPQKVFSFALSEEVLQEFSCVVKELMRISVDREFKSEKLLDTMSDLTYNT